MVVVAAAAAVVVVVVVTAAAAAGVGGGLLFLLVVGAARCAGSIFSAEDSMFVETLDGQETVGFELVSRNSGLFFLISVLLRSLMAKVSRY